MLKIFSAIFVIANLWDTNSANPTSCTPNAGECTDAGTKCFGQKAYVSVVDPDISNGFRVMKFQKTKSTCEAEEVPVIMGATTDTSCRKATASKDVDVPYPVCDPSMYAKFQNFLALDVYFASNGVPDDTSACAVDAPLSTALNGLIDCIVTQEMINDVACSGGFPSDCPDWAAAIVNNYAECACTALFEAVGVDGYDYIPVINSWIQGYLGAAGEFFSGCDVSITDISCDGLIENCEVNDAVDLNTCNEIPEIPDDVPGYIEGTIAACIVNGNYIKQRLKRGGLWDALKKGMTMQWEVEGVTIDIDAFMERSRLNGPAARGRGNQQPETTDSADLNVDITCDDDEWIGAFRIRFTYNDWEELVDLKKTYLSTVDEFIPGVIARIIENTIDDDPESVGLVLSKLELTLELYRQDGTYVNVELAAGEEGAAAQYSVRAIFAVLAVAMMAWI